MRTLWTVMSIVLLLHALLLAGGAIWLGATDRMSEDRMAEVVEIFSQTQQEEEVVKEDAARQQAEDADKARQAAWLRRTADGPAPMQHELEQQVIADEVSLQRLERFKREIADLRRSNQLARELLTKEREQLDLDKKAFNDLLEKERKLRSDEDFKLAVQMYEQLKPKQTKEIFQQLMTRQQIDDVVRYLAAMQTRKAAAVLKEFKNAADIPQVTDLIQRLRERGINLLSRGSLSNNNTSGAT